MWLLAKTTPARSSGQKPWLQGRYLRYRRGSPSGGVGWAEREAWQQWEMWDVLDDKQAYPGSTLQLAAQPATGLQEGRCQLQCQCTRALVGNMARSSQTGNRTQKS